MIFPILLAFAIGFVGANNPLSLTCDAGSDEYQGSCYTFILDKERIGPTRAACQAINAHPVSIQTADEFTYLKGKIISKRGDVSGSNIWWTFGRRVKRWVWEQTGILIDFAAVFWGKNQPQYRGGHRATLTDFGPGQPFGLNDRHDHHTHHTLCEKSVNVAGNCPGAGNWVNFENSCYRFFPGRVNHAAATSICSGVSAQLVTVESLDEFNFLKVEIINRRGQVNGQNSWWTEAELAKVWIWPDTRQLIDFNVLNAGGNSWAPSQPDDDDNTRRLVLNDNGVDLQFGFDDRVPWNKHYIICEYELQTPGPKNGDIRLAHGPNPEVGVPQIYFNNAWGYICDTAGFHLLGWANVFCNELCGVDAVSVKFTRKVQPSVQALISNADLFNYENPSCRLRTANSMTECGVNKRTPSCGRRRYRKTQWLDCQLPE